MRFAFILSAFKITKGVSIDDKVCLLVLCSEVCPYLVCLAFTRLFTGDVWRADMDTKAQRTAELPLTFQCCKGKEMSVYKKYYNKTFVYKIITTLLKKKIISATITAYLYAIFHISTLTGFESSSYRCVVNIRKKLGEENGLLLRKINPQYGFNIIILTVVFQLFSL